MTPEEILKQEYSKLIGNPDKVYAQNPSIIQAAHSAIRIYALHARIQERKTHIYVMEQDLLDNGPEGEGIYSEDYRKCMADEIENHKAYIADMEDELNKLKIKK